MSRYIGAEWLKTELGDVNMDIYTDEVKEYIDSAPSIDIVRCKECKHSPKNTKKIPLHDSCYTFKPDDFCSYGERKESE